MKLALIQCDVKSGDLTGNSRRILEVMRKIDDADLCIVPAGALNGPDGINECMPNYGLFVRQILDEMAREMASCPALLAHAPTVCYFVINSGSWHAIGRQFEFKGMRLGVELKPDDASKIDLGIAMQPRPFTPASNEEWELILSGFCRQGCVWGVSANLVGGYGSKVYAGGSFAMAPDGSLAARAKIFAEDCLYVDTDDLAGAGRIEPGVESWESGTWMALTMGLRDFLAKAAVRDVLLGISGGMDSALVACIAARALGSERVTGVLMPSPYTSANSMEDAKQLAANLGIKTLEIPISSAMDAFRQLLEPAYAAVAQMPGEVSAENIQARIRGMLLMALANYSGAIVLNCGNKSEAALGYCTLYGDTVGAIAVIGDLLKTQVYKLGRWLCQVEGRALIPERIFTKAPSAELRPDQKDTDTLPPYEVLDAQLNQIYALADPFASEMDLKFDALRRKVAAFAFKRSQSPPVITVSDWKVDGCR